MNILGKYKFNIKFNLTETVDLLEVRDYPKTIIRISS